MEFFAFHGHYKEEQIIGTRFKVDLEFEYQSHQAEISDRLDDAINYQEVFSLIKKEMEISSHLLEHVARRILNALKQQYPMISQAKVILSKLNPQLGGKVKQVTCILSY